MHDGLIGCQERHATISRSTACHVCDKRIGDAVFAVLPDSRPVHFHCSRDLSAFSAGGRSAGPAAAGLARRRAPPVRLRLYDLDAESSEGALLLPLPRNFFRSDTDEDGDAATPDGSADPVLAPIGELDAALFTRTFVVAGKGGKR